jgi:tetratricopeptide (TPR) repeat protein
MNQWELQQAAQSYLEAEDWQSAQEAWKQLTLINPVNGKFWQELGAVQYRQKNYRDAIATYEQAMELRSARPFYFVYNIACCYALLNEPDTALEWLEHAFELGFNNLKLAQTDEDLQSLHDNPRFRSLVELADTSNMTHNDGLRHDLALLVRQLKRVGYDPFRLITETEFDKAVQTLHDNIPNLTELQVVLEFAKLLRMAGDGHTSLSINDAREDFCTNVPLEYYLFEEGLFITRTTPKYESLLGMQVIAMDDNPVQTVIEATYPIISRDNDMWLKHIPPHFIRNIPILHALGQAHQPDKITLTVCDNTGNQQKVDILPEDKTPVSHKMWRERENEMVVLPNMPQTMRQQYRNYWYEYDADAQLLYFQFNQVRDMEGESLAEFADKLFAFIDENPVDKLLIDVRYNTGGNTYLHIPIVNRLAGHQRINRRGHFFVLIGRRTYSAAMNFVTLLDRHTNAIFVGEPTGSSPNFVGETIIVCLPYSKVDISISDLFWQSSWPTDERTWIAPDYYVPPRFADVAAGCDAALEAVRLFPSATTES